MYFEKSTLQNQFHKNWLMNGELTIVSEKVTELIQKVEIFEHINKLG